MTHRTMDPVDTVGGDLYKSESVSSDGMFNWINFEHGAKVKLTKAKSLAVKIAVQGLLQVDTMSLCSRGGWQWQWQCVCNLVQVLVSLVLFLTWTFFQIINYHFGGLFICHITSGCKSICSVDGCWGSIRFNIYLSLDLSLEFSRWVAYFNSSVNIVGGLCKLAFWMLGACVTRVCPCYDKNESNNWSHGHTQVSIELSTLYIWTVADI